MYETPQSPVNPLPPVVIFLVLAMVLAEGAFSLGARGLAGGPEAVGWRLLAVRDYGFSSPALAWMIETRTIRPELLIRFVTYPFLHGSFTHAIFAVVMTLALGKFVGERISQWAVFVLFIGSSVFGALIYGLLLPEGPVLIGAFPGIYGLIGGFTCLLWLHLGAIGEQQARAFSLIGVLLGLQLVFGILFGGGPDWVAEIAGFVGGFGLSFVLVPGGWHRLRDKIRHE